MKVVTTLIWCFSALVYGRIVHISKHVRDPRSDTCPETLEWFSCSFNVTCSESDLDTRELTSRNCTAGCFCPQDYYKHKDKCLRSIDCPEEKEIDKTCPSPLEYDDCYFNISCSEYPISSSEYERKHCRPGCYCPRDFYVYNNKCYFHTECPDECSTGRHWKECGNHCKELCPVLQPADECRTSPNCSAGCFCKHGRRSFAGHCLSLNDCPTNIKKAVYSEIRSDFSYMEL